MLRRSEVSLAVALMVAAAGVSSAQAPSFTGTWKLNPARSKLAGQTVTIERTASGLLHFDSQGFAYDFDLTGKPFPLPDGGTTEWRAVNATTWEVTNRLGRAISSPRRPSAESCTGSRPCRDSIR